MARRVVALFVFFARTSSYGAACLTAEECPTEDAASLLQVRHGTVSRAAADSGCSADALPEYRPGEVLLDLKQAKPCIQQVVAPAHLAKQTVEALANYYWNFYAFAAIAADPPAGGYTFPEPFADAGLGIFGAEGGGAPAEQSKVDLVGGLKMLAESIPKHGMWPVVSWVAPTNDLFMGLRDAHVGWAARGMPPTKELDSLFRLVLMTEEPSELKLTISSASGEIAVNGAAVPIVRGADGSVVESIGGEEPMKWLSKNLAEVPTFAFPYKSLGARMNKLIETSLKHGVSFALGSLGTLDGLAAEPILVQLRSEDGSSKTHSWQWKVIARTSSGGCASFACLSAAVPRRLTSPGRVAHELTLAAVILRRDWKTEPAMQASSMLSTERSEEASPPASPAAPPQAQRQALPDNVFAWLPEPTDTTSSYGFVAFRTDDDGAEYGVLKHATFMLVGERAPRGWDARWNGMRVIEAMREKWEAFAAEAQRRGVDRLVVDVSGNGGGSTALAWQFVQFMLPDLPFADTCGQVSRTVPRAFELNKKVNKLPLIEFMKHEGLRQDRYKQFEDPAFLEAVTSNAIAMVEIMFHFGLSSFADELQLSKASENITTTKEVAMKLFELAKGWWEEGRRDPFLGLYAPSDWEEAYNHIERRSRGGDSRNFSAKVSDCPIAPAGNLSNPFMDIIFVSDGYCGSSCYIATGTTWAMARKTGSRRVRIATFGGLGGSLEEAKRTLSGTSFPGGDVETDGVNAMFKPVVKSVLVESLLANFIGSSDMLRQLGDVLKEMVSMSPFYSDALPQFTHSQLYQKAFGDNAPPAEYVFVPTDIYLPYWFSNVGGARTAADSWDLQQLELMWISTAKAFGN